MIARRIVQAWALALGGALAFAAGALLAQQILFREMNAATIATSEGLVASFSHWGNLMPFNFIDGQQRKNCIGYDVETGAQVGPWEPESDGRCRLRDFIIRRIIADLDARASGWTKK